MVQRGEIAALIAVVVLAHVSWFPCTAMARQSSGGPEDALEIRLRERIAQAPTDASNWRLLARHRRQRGELAGALEACEQAIALEPDNVSVQFEMGQILASLHQPEKASQHLTRAIYLAPSSEYAAEAAETLEQIGYEQPEFSSLTADRQSNRFGGIPITNDWNPQTNPLELGFETGFLYNDNVQLAPTSRVVSRQGLASWQGFLSPHLQYAWFQGDRWTSGLGFDGYFSVNEAAFDAFNLQDYQPSLFAERVWELGEALWTARFQYDFTLDEFAGTTFATRHAMTALLTWDELTQVTVAYWSADYSNFANDGVEPTYTSLDGWTHTIGASRSYFLDRGPFDILRGGLDGQIASLQGDDFAYRSLFLYIEGERPMPWKTFLIAQGRWGLRNFPRFVGSPDRDETLWRASLEWQKRLGDHWTSSLFATYDVFATPHPDFDTQRLLSGLKLSYQW